MTGHVRTSPMTYLATEYALLLRKIIRASR
jgi:hypothetical protein